MPSQKRKDCERVTGYRSIVQVGAGSEKEDEKEEEEEGEEERRGGERKGVF